MNIKVFFILFITISSLLTISFELMAESCTKEMVIEAESRIDELNSWAKLYSHYKKFKACDDGAVAEGYSWAVTQLLTEIKNSSDIPSKCEFREFVLKHIDELISTEEYKSLKKTLDNCSDDFCLKALQKLEAQVK